jgi:tRNA pseudouridine38-40 synthase
MRYLMHLAYKGTHYNGWQKQQNAIGVQNILDEKLSMLLGGEAIESIGCGRTDTGVHAKHFGAHFDTHQIINEGHLTHKLNHVLPDDIAVYSIHQVKNEFNARFDALSRTYQYHITTKPNPFLLEFAWYQYGHLNIETMNEAASLLIGKKSFETFSKVHTQVNNFICEVTHAKWEQQADVLVFAISANRFLRNMVRAIVGTLIEVGRGKITVADVQQIMSSNNRSEAGQSVPAHGLLLTEIIYPHFTLK